MRVVIVGAGQVAVETSRILLHRGHEVILVERDRERIDELREGLDCAFLHGDGSRPDILKEAGPEEAHILLCLTDSDQANIIASVVGRSLGYGKVVTRIEDAAYETICLELGLENTIVPSRTIGRYLGDTAEGIDVLELRTILRGEARFFTLVVGRAEEGDVRELELSAQEKPICLYREDEFVMVDEDTRLRRGDELVILTDARHLADLRKRWAPRSSEDSEGSED